MKPPDTSASLDSTENLNTIYDLRHTPKLNRDRAIVWDCVVSRIVQPRVSPDASFLDLGAGDCLVVNRIVAKEKFAVDLGSRTAQLADTDVTVLVTSSTNLSVLADESLDTVFSSNFFEHLPSKADLLETLAEIRRILRPGGELIVIMPNLRYVGGRYWDYLDHQIPLTDRSLAEAVLLSGMTPETVAPRFLPYTINHSRLPRHRLLISLYLRVPLLWRLFGQQLLLTARKSR